MTDSAETVPLEILTKREREGIRKALPHRYKSTGTLGGHGNWAKPVIEKLLNTCDELESQLDSERACPSCGSTVRVHNNGCKKVKP